MTRFRIGQHTTQEDLNDDWMMTHELDHLAFPSLPDDQHWMEEGLATYVEPIARVQAGELKPQQIWRDMRSRQREPASRGRFPVKRDQQERQRKQAECEVMRPLAVESDGEEPMHGQ